MKVFAQEIASKCPALFKLGSLALAGMIIFILAIKGRAFFSISEVLLVIALMISCYKLKRVHIFPRKNVLFAFAFFACGLLLPSIYNGEWKNISVALDYVHNMLTFFIMYAGACCFAKENIIYKAITIGALVTAGIFLVAFSDPHVGWSRLAIWDNPNIVADRLAIPIPFILVAFYELKGSMMWRGINALSLLIIVAALGLTRSRGGIIGLICGLMAIGVMYWPICRIQWTYIKKMIMSTVIVALASSMLLAIVMHTFPRTSSDVARENIMYVAYHMFEENPIMGVGLANYVEGNNRQVEIMRKSVSDGKDASDIAKVANYSHAHNVLLQLLATTGITGISGYVVFMLIIWYHLMRSVIRYSHNGVAWAMMAVIVFVNIHGLVDFSVWSSIPSWMFMGVLGLALAFADMKSEIVE